MRRPAVVLILDRRGREGAAGRRPREDRPRGGRVGRPAGGGQADQALFWCFGETSSVVEERGEMLTFLVGIANGSTSSTREAYVHFVGVHPDHRGRGVGERLYGLFFDEARRRGCDGVRCITSPVNKGSIASHARMGFGIEAGDGDNRRRPRPRGLRRGRQGKGRVLPVAAVRVPRGGGSCFGEDRR